MSDPRAQKGPTHGHGKVAPQPTFAAGHPIIATLLCRGRSAQGWASVRTHSCQHMSPVLILTDPPSLPYPDSCKTSQGWQGD